MRLDRARHAHCSEKKRNKADKIEEAIEIFQRCAQVSFPFRDGVVFKTEALNLRHQRQDARLRIRARRELHIVAVVRDAARLKQTSITQTLQRDVNPRREGAGGGSFARHFLQAHLKP